MLSTINRVPARGLPARGHTPGPSLAPPQPSGHSPTPAACGAPGWPWRWPGTGRRRRSGQGFGQTEIQGQWPLPTLLSPHLSLSKTPPRSSPRRPLCLSPPSSRRQPLSAPGRFSARLQGALCFPHHMGTCFTGDIPRCCPGLPASGPTLRPWDPASLPVLAWLP